MGPEDLGALELRRLARDLRADVEALDRLAAAVARVASGDAPLGEAEQALLAWKLHGWYTALEASLERIARGVEGSLPVGPACHRDLLRGMTLALPGVRPAVLDSACFGELAELLALRQFLRHAYTIPPDEELLRLQARRLVALQPAVRRDLLTFEAVLLGWADTLVPAREP
jgi:hypothetical protein